MAENSMGVFILNAFDFVSLQTLLERVVNNSFCSRLTE